MLASIGLVLRLGKRSDATTTYAPQVHTTLSEEVPVSSAMLRPPRVPESAEGRALVEQGYLRTTDIVPILGVTIQRVSQIIAEREDFPRQRKTKLAVAAALQVWRRPQMGSQARRPAASEFSQKD